MVKPFGSNTLKIVILAHDDHKREVAYQQEGYENYIFRGDRPQELSRFIRQMIKQIKQSPPKHMVIVSDDPGFLPLCDEVWMITDLSIWAHSHTVPRELSQSNYRFQPLEELLPSLKISKIDVRIDLENIFIALVQRGWQPNLKEMIYAIRQALEDSGEIVTITGYADWSALNRHHGDPNVEWQRELTLAGAETRYVINQYGKNTADMKIADDIRTLVEYEATGSSAIDIIVLATMDRDFRPIVETVRRRGKRVIILGLEGGVSRELEAAGNEVRYLDSFLNFPRTGKESSESSHLEDVAFMMRVAALMHRNGWRFVYRDWLKQEFGGSPENLRKLISEEWLRPISSSSIDPEEQARTLEVNPNNTTAQAAHYLARWIPAHLDFCLNQRRMPDVDSNFLANGMNHDTTLSGMGIARTHKAAENWLHAAEIAGLVVHGEQPHPRNPAKIITTWRLPEQNVVTSPQFSRSYLRQSLTTNLRDGELSLLLFDYFRPVHREVDDEPRLIKIEALLDYVEQHALQERLVAALLEVNPASREQLLAPVDYENHSLLLEEKVRTADVLESQARESLAQLDYERAVEHLSNAISLDADRVKRLIAEFGFVLHVRDAGDSSSSDPQCSQERLNWQSKLWRILSERNDFVLPRLDDRKIEMEVEEVEQTKASPIIRELVPSRAEQRGEDLENSVLSLFKEFFRIGEESEQIILTKLRQQRRGTQFGQDIAFEFSLGFECSARWNQTIRCHVECKNISHAITLKDVADKLISQKHSSPDLDLWILISPRIDPSNELDLFLDRWKSSHEFPFDIQVWSPATGVEEFFGLEPAVYDKFYKTDEQSHPRNWDDSKRAMVYERWQHKLQPSVRLPEGWYRYLSDPLFLCLGREYGDAMETIFTNHVTMHCRNEAGTLMPRPLEYYVREWLNQPHRPVFFLLGDFGDGKSFFTYALARRMANEFLQSPKTGWIPLRFALREFWDAQTPRNFLKRRLDDFGADFAGWVSLHASQRMLIILDGFDEMSKEMDPANITRNIDALIKSYKQFETCKVLITSRTHFFERQEDVRRLTSRLDNPIFYYLAPISRQATLSHLEVIAKQQGLEDSLTRIHMLHDPIGLASKPLFLQMLKDTLHDLPDDLDEVTLYEKYVQNTLRRKAEQLDDKHLKTDRDKLFVNLISILEEIAVELQTSKQEYISLNRFAEARQKKFAELLWKMTGSDEEQQDATVRVGVRSLLSRVNTPNMQDEWTVDFCHRSVKEYFVARSLCTAVCNSIDEGERFLKAVPLNHEILDFAASRLRKMEEHHWRDILSELIQRAIPEREPGRLGGNAMTLLYRLSPRLPDADWTGKVFDFADLEGADLSGKSFHGSSFRFADLTNVNFERANFEECDFTGVRIEETSTITALAAKPTRNRVLAGYGDGTAREWDLIHPRKTQSWLVSSYLPRQCTKIGFLEDEHLWMLTSREFAFWMFGENGQLEQLAHFPIKVSYRIASLTETDLLIIEDIDETKAKLILIDIEELGIIQTLETSSVTLCVPLGRDAFALNDRGVGLRIIESNSSKEPESMNLPGDVVTCVSSMCVQEGVYLIAYGQNEGSVHLSIVDLRQRPWQAQEVFAQRMHAGPITAVAFLDESRVLSGGKDRTIVVTRLDTKDKLKSAVQERKLQLTLQCKGMRIDGLKGSAEQQKLAQLVMKAGD